MGGKEGRGSWGGGKGEVGGGGEGEAKQESGLCRSPAIAPFLNEKRSARTMEHRHRFQKPRPDAIT